MPDGLLITALPQIGLAEAVQHAHLTGPVAGQPEQRQGPLVVVRCPLIAALLQLDDAEVVQRAGLAAPVAGLPVPVQGQPEVPGGPLITMQAQVDTAEPGERGRLGGAVASAARSPVSRAARRAWPWMAMASP